MPKEDRNMKNVSVCFQDFEQAVLSLKHSGAVTLTEVDDIVIRKSLNKHTTFFSQMFEPFLLAYWVSSLLECHP